MDYLQYFVHIISLSKFLISVLNLIINGLPSIPYCDSKILEVDPFSFKPYYKWITFNTKDIQEMFDRYEKFQF